MNRNIPTRREVRDARDSAFKKPDKPKCLMGVPATVLTLMLLISGPTAGAMAATEPTLGPAVTASQAAAAMANAPYESITGVSETTQGLNIDVNMSDPSTALSVNTVSDDGAGTYKIQGLASGITAGNWTEVVGESFDATFAGDAATITVTGVNGTTIDLTVSFATVPATTPVFTVSGSSTGSGAPVAQKGSPTAVDVSKVLDTRTQAKATWNDLISQQTPSSGYTWDTSSLMFIDPLSGAATPTEKTPGANLAIANGDVNATSIPDWNGFPNLTMKLTEKWAGAGAEPAGWSPATITFQLKLQIIGATVAANPPASSDCTVAGAPAGGTGFSVAAPMATSGYTGLTCNLVAVADTVTIAADATQASISLPANDTTTNSSYSVDSTSIECRTPDGSGFANDVIYPGQFELVTDPSTGITHPKRIGTEGGEFSILCHETEFKLDSSGNKVVGGSASALLTVKIEPLATTPETPVTTPETPVTVPETPVTVPVSSEIAGGTPVDTPTTVSVNAASRPFANMGDTSASFGGPSAPLSTAAVVTPKQDVNAGLGEAELALIALGTAGAFMVKARHRKVQKSDVSA